MTVHSGLPDRDTTRHPTLALLRRGLAAAAIAGLLTAGAAGVATATPRADITLTQGQTQALYDAAQTGDGTLREKCRNSLPAGLGAVACERALRQLKGALATPPNGRCLAVASVLPPKVGSFRYVTC